MKHGAAALCMVLLLVAGGCRRSPERSPDERLNTPLTVEEARELMRALDRDVAENVENPDVAPHIRRRLTGRLLSAGVSEKEIEDWIDAPVPAHMSDEPSGSER